ncbi:hypothetical protein AAAY25_03525, partial [Brotaphodocola catenula]
PRNIHFLVNENRLTMPECIKRMDFVAFDGESLPCFENVFIILHPDYENQKKNRQKQLQAKIHLAKQKKSDSDEKNALFVKLSLKSNPIGIGLCE